MGTRPAGCDVCRANVYGYSITEPRKVAARVDGPTFLLKCAACGTYWEDRIRVVVPISEEEARERYPLAFGSSDDVA